MADRKFLDFLDMFDGGGAGRMGDKFEGGGLFSALGNLVASPYGSQDEERRKARMAFYGSDNIGGAPTAAPAPVQTAGSMNTSTVALPTEQERYGLNFPLDYSPQLQYGGRGSVGMPSPAPQYGGRGSVGMPSPNYTASGVTPATAYLDPRERFARDLVEMYGPEMASTVMNSGIVEDTYRGYVDRGYSF